MADEITNEELAALIRQGIDVQQNLEKLYIQNKGIISRIAYKYNSLNDYEDLMQEGFLGLERAARYYDPDNASGSSFLTYAVYWITSTVLRYKYDNGFVIRIPEFMYDRINRYKAFISDYRKEHGTFPDKDTINTALNITMQQQDKIRRAIAILSCDLSLDQEVEGEDDSVAGTLADVIRDPENCIDELINAIQAEDLKVDLWREVDKLSEKESYVLHRRYEDGYSFQKCGDELNLSCQRIQQIHHEAIKKLRSPAHAKKFVQYVEDQAISDAINKGSFKSFKYTGRSCVEQTVIRFFNKY